MKEDRKEGEGVAGVQAEEGEAVGLIAVCLRHQQKKEKKKSLHLNWDSGRKCFEIKFFNFCVRKTNYYIRIDNGHS